MIKKHKTIIDVKIFAILLLTLILLDGCSAIKISTENQGRKKALSTINIINDFVKNVAGDKIYAVSLIPVGSDPHIYEPVPSNYKAPS